MHDTLCKCHWFVSVLNSHFCVHFIARLFSLSLLGFQHVLNILICKDRCRSPCGLPILGKISSFGVVYLNCTLYRLFSTIVVQCWKESLLLFMAVTSKHVMENSSLFGSFFRQEGCFCFHVRSKKCDKQTLASLCLAICLSVSPSVCPPARPPTWNSTPTKRIVIKLDARLFFEVLFRKFKFH